MQKSRRTRLTRTSGFQQPKVDTLLVEHFASLILDAADGILHLARGLVCSSFGFGLAVARHLTNSFFDRALCLLSGTFNAVFIPDYSPL